MNEIHHTNGGLTAEYYHFLSESFVSQTEALSDSEASYVRACREKELLVDEPGTEVVRMTLDLVRSRIEMMKQLLHLFRNQESDDQYRNQLNNLTRSIIRLLGSARSHCEYDSPGYDQSTHPNGFELERQNGYEGVLYNRWESPYVRSRESELESILQLPDQHSLLLHSSGMAAFGTIQEYLMRHVLQPGKKVWSVNDIYHEAENRIASLGRMGIEVLQEKEYEGAKVVDRINEESIDVVYFSSVMNTYDLRMFSFEDLLPHLPAIKKEVLFVYDDTMSSAFYRPDLQQNLPPNVKIISFGSLNKYFQFESTVELGQIIVPEELKQTFMECRQLAGTIAYDSNLAQFPQYDRELLLGRVELFTQNALLSAQIISESGPFHVKHPLLPDHPDHHQAQKAPLIASGGVFMLNFKAPERNTRDQWSQYLRDLVLEAKRQSIPVVIGDSYGHSIPRIHIGGSRSDSPYLRVCAGDRSQQTTQRFAELFGTVA